MAFGIWRRSRRAFCRHAYGAVSHGCALDEDGAIRHADDFARVDFGAPDGRVDELADQFATLYLKTSVIALHNPNIMREMWDKFVFWRLPPA